MTSAHTLRRKSYPVDRRGATRGCQRTGGGHRWRHSAQLATRTAHTHIPIKPRTRYLLAGSDRGVEDRCCHGGQLLHEMLLPTLLRHGRICGQLCGDDRPGDIDAQPLPPPLKASILAAVCFRAEDRVNMLRLDQVFGALTYYFPIDGALQHSVVQLLCHTHRQHDSETSVL